MLQAVWQSDVEQTIVEVISNGQVSKIPRHIPQDMACLCVSGYPVKGWQAEITAESLLDDNPDSVYKCLGSQINQYIQYWVGPVRAL